jgi:hypothetical protein
MSSGATANFEYFMMVPCYSSGKNCSSVCKQSLKLDRFAGTIFAAGQPIILADSAHALQLFR